MACLQSFYNYELLTNGTDCRIFNEFEFWIWNSLWRITNYRFDFWFLISPSWRSQFWMAKLQCPLNHWLCHITGHSIILVLFCFQFSFFRISKFQTIENIWTIFPYRIIRINMFESINYKHAMQNAIVYTLFAWMNSLSKKCHYWPPGNAFNFGLRALARTQQFNK